MKSFIYRFIFVTFFCCLNFVYTNDSQSIEKISTEYVKMKIYSTTIQNSSIPKNIDIDRKSSHLLDGELFLNNKIEVFTNNIAKLKDTKIRIIHGKKYIHNQSRDCTNDDSISDSYGDTCSSWYDAYPSSCGSYDTDEFIAAELCCVCGGGFSDDGSLDDGGDDGSLDDGGDDGSLDDGGDDGSLDDGGDDGSSDGGEECINDDSISDSYGDTCSSWYDDYPSSCGSYDTDEFIAAELCCACGGGSSGDGGDDGTCDDVDIDGICDDVDDCIGQFDDCGVCNGDNLSCQLLGDLNSDDIVNVQDIIIMVNIILGTDEYDPLSDLNEDGISNVLDIIVLVNIILEEI